MHPAREQRLDTRLVGRHCQGFGLWAGALFEELLGHFHRFASLASGEQGLDPCLPFSGPGTSQTLS